MTEVSCGLFPFRIKFIPILIICKPALRNGDKKGIVLVVAMNAAFASHFEYGSLHPDTDNADRAVLSLNSLWFSHAKGILLCKFPWNTSTIIFDDKALLIKFDFSPETL